MSSERAGGCETNHGAYRHIDFDQRDAEEGDSLALAAETSGRSGSDEDAGGSHRQEDSQNKEKPGKLQETSQAVHMAEAGQQQSPTPMISASNQSVAANTASKSNATQNANS